MSDPKNNPEQLKIESSISDSDVIDELQEASSSAEVATQSTADNIASANVPGSLSGIQILTSTDVPSQSGNPINADTPSTSSDPIKSDVPSTSSDPIKYDVPSTSSDPIEADVLSTSHDSINSDAPSTSNDSLKAYSPSTLSDPKCSDAPSTTVYPISVDASSTSFDDPVNVDISHALSSETPSTAAQSTLNVIQTSQSSKSPEKSSSVSPDADQSSGYQIPTSTTETDSLLKALLKSPTLKPQNQQNKKAGNSSGTEIETEKSTYAVKEQQICASKDSSGSDTPTVLRPNLTSGNLQHKESRHNLPDDISPSSEETATGSVETSLGMEETSDLGSLSSGPSLFSPSSTSSDDRPKAALSFNLRISSSDSSIESKLISDIPSCSGNQTMLCEESKVSQTSQTPEHLQVDRPCEVLDISVVIPDSEALSQTVRSATPNIKPISSEAGKLVSSDLDECEGHSSSKKPRLISPGKLSPEAIVGTSSQTAACSPSHGNLDIEFRRHINVDFNRRCVELDRDIRGQFEMEEDIQHEHSLSNLHPLWPSYYNLVRARIFMQSHFTLDLPTFPLRNLEQFCSFFNPRDTTTAFESDIRVQLFSAVPEQYRNVVDSLQYRLRELLVLIDYLIQNTFKILNLLKSADSKDQLLNYIYLYNRFITFLLDRVRYYRDDLGNVIDRNDLEKLLFLSNSLTNVILKILLVFNKYRQDDL